MLNNWAETTIGSQITLQRGFDITKSEQLVGIIPVISSGGISSFHNTAAASGPGVVLGRKGVVGSVYYIDSDYWPHDTTLWVKDFHGNYPRFVYYFFKYLTPVITNMDVGSANPTLNRNHVHPIRTIWPSLTEQHSIAEILGALDDKIKLNNKMNATLLHIARAIFTEWFIDNAESYKVGTIGDFISEINERNSSREQIQVFSAVKSGELLPSDEVFTKQVYSRDSSKYKKIQKNNFAYNPARINIGSIGMLEKEKGLVSPVYTAFSVKPGLEWFLLFFIRLPQTKSFIEQLCSGSVRQNLTFDNFASIEIPIPTENKLQEFNERWLDLHKMIKQNEEESHTLGRLRDSLLPKLMKGEVKVKV